MKRPLRGTPVEISGARCYVIHTPGAGAHGRRAAQEDDVLSQFNGAVQSGTAWKPSVSGLPHRRQESDDLLQTIRASLEDDKAEDVVAIDLAGKSEIADWMVIASGRSTRQVSAIAEKLVERIKAATGASARVEGKEAADWVLIDAGDVIVHVFRPEVRDFYQLEKMWMSPAEAAGRAFARS
jgi:ribosome-associated protein